MGGAMVLLAHIGRGWTAVVGFWLRRRSLGYHHRRTGPGPAQSRKDRRARFCWRHCCM